MRRSGLLINLIEDMIIVGQIECIMIDEYCRVIEKVHINICILRRKEERRFSRKVLSTSIIVLYKNKEL